jgi:hypothetical protein
LVIYQESQSSQKKTARFWRWRYCEFRKRELICSCHDATSIPENLNLRFKSFVALPGKHDNPSVCVTNMSTTQCYKRLIFGDKIFDSSETFLISIKFNIRSISEIVPHIRQKFYGHKKEIRIKELVVVSNTYI